MLGRIETVGIVSALDSEINRFKDEVENIKTVEIGKHIFYTGNIGSKKIVFTETGVGKVNAAINTQLLIDRFSPDILINTGIAGGLDSRLKHTDLVVANELNYHDFETRLLESYSPNVSSFKVEEKYLKVAEDILKDKKYFEGLIVTGDQFITDSKVKEDIKSRFNALCVEMEGAAIAHAAYLSGIPFIVIRCISDFADDDGDNDYDNFEIIAANKASEFTIKFIKEI